MKFVKSLFKKKIIKTEIITSHFFFQNHDYTNFYFKN